MLRYLAKRIVWALPLLLAIVVINFLVTRLVPGDPISAVVGEYPVPPEYMEQVRHTLGLDQPLSVQLWRYLLALGHGDFGFSFANRESVLVLIAHRAAATLQLMIPALTLSAVIGILLAKVAAGRRNGASDAAVTVVTLFGFSVPIFWLGQILIVVFAVSLGWLPAQGLQSIRGAAPGLPQVWDRLSHWIMPGFCVMTFYSAFVTRVARASLAEARTQDFVTTARAKGMSETAIFWRHILPNASIPIVTVIGYNFGHALTGAIMAEAVFAWPGLGTLFMASITNRDYPVLQGIFLITAITVVVLNLLTDLVYGLIDPRVRQGLAARG